MQHKNPADRSTFVISQALENSFRKHISEYQVPSVVKPIELPPVHFSIDPSLHSINLAASVRAASASSVSRMFEQAEALNLSSIIKPEHDFIEAYGKLKSGF